MLRYPFFWYTSYSDAAIYIALFAMFMYPTVTYYSAPKMGIAVTYYKNTYALPLVAGPISTMVVSMVSPPTTRIYETDITV